MAEFVHLCEQHLMDISMVLFSQNYADEAMASHMLSYVMAANSELKLIYSAVAYHKYHIIERLL